MHTVGGILLSLGGREGGRGGNKKPQRRRSLCGSEHVLYSLHRTLKGYMH